MVTRSAWAEFVCAVSLILTYLFQNEEGGGGRLDLEGGNWNDHELKTSVGSVIAACSFHA